MRIVRCHGNGLCGHGKTENEKTNIDHPVCLCYDMKTDWMVCFFEEARMKREEKNALSRRRILDAAFGEFFQRGYDGASLNNVCTERGISKGIIYHHFQDKDDLYLLCVRACFDRLTAYMRGVSERLQGTPEQRLKEYFDARLRFLAEQPDLLGMFVGVALNPPAHLEQRVSECRAEFDALNIEVLSAVLNSGVLREGLNVADIVDDFGAYMDFFNMRFRRSFAKEHSAAQMEGILREHEERCHRQLDILLHGVMGE